MNKTNNSSGESEETLEVDFILKRHKMLGKIGSKRQKMACQM